jgi:hypothetical protein
MIPKKPDAKKMDPRVKRAGGQALDQFDPATN